MEAAPANSIRQRLCISALIASAYVLSLSPLAVLGDGGMFWIAILGLSGLPMLGLALLIGWFRAAQIAAAPWKWSIGASLGAITIGSIVMGVFTGQPLIGLLGIPVALFAPLAFVTLVKIFMPAAPLAGN